METLAFLSLDEIKQQCRVDFEEDDRLLLMYGAAAERAVVDATRRPLRELAMMGGGAVPVRLRLAALMLAAHFYRVREPVAGLSQAAVPYTLDYLVKPYVRLTERPAPPCRRAVAGLGSDGANLNGANEADETSEKLTMDS